MTLPKSSRPTSLPLFYLQKDVQQTAHPDRPLWTDWCDLSWFEVITLGVTFGAILAFLLYSVHW